MRLLSALVVIGDLTHRGRLREFRENDAPARQTQTAISSSDTPSAIPIV